MSDPSPKRRRIEHRKLVHNRFIKRNSLRVAEWVSCPNGIPVTTGAGGRETYQHHFLFQRTYRAGLPSVARCLRPALKSVKPTAPRQSHLAEHLGGPTSAAPPYVKVDRMAARRFSPIMQLLVVSSASPMAVDLARVSQDTRAFYFVRLDPVADRHRALRAARRVANRATISIAL